MLVSLRRQKKLRAGLLGMGLVCLVSLFSVLGFASESIRGRCEQVFNSKFESSDRALEYDDVSWDDIEKSEMVSSQVLRVPLKDGSSGILRLPSPNSHLNGGNDVYFETFANRLASELDPGLGGSIDLIYLDRQSITALDRVHSEKSEYWDFAEVASGWATLSRFHEDHFTGAVYIRDQLRPRLLIEFMNLISRKYSRLMIYREETGEKGPLSAEELKRVSGGEVNPTVFKIWSQLSSVDKNDLTQSISSALGRYVKETNDQLPFDIDQLSAKLSEDERVFESFAYKMDGLILAEFPARLREKLANYWGVTVLLGIKDPHFGNWMVGPNESLKAIDLANRSLEFDIATSIKGLSQQSLFIWILEMSSWQMSNIVRPYFSESFRRKLDALDAEQIRQLTNLSKMKLSDEQIDGILLRRNGLLNR